MSNLPVFVIMLLLCSMFYSSDCQKFTQIKCAGTKECIEPCKGITGKPRAKCMNRKCTCYM
uniref:Uncharacterized protein n=1 Tax=Isometrus maculatus TaxID=497827 RepID=A0A0U1SCI3_ISOMC|nr:hypothetical protein [Isometrus maculatus]